MKADRSTPEITSARFSESARRAAAASVGGAFGLGRGAVRHRGQDLLQLPHATAQRQRRHLEVRVIGYTPVIRGEELRLLPQFRQLALDAV